jgi:hypothetical protein
LHPKNISRSSLRFLSKGAVCAARREGKRFGPIQKSESPPRLHLSSDARLIIHSSWGYWQQIDSRIASTISLDISRIFSVTCRQHPRSIQLISVHCQSVRIRLCCMLLSLITKSLTVYYQLASTASRAARITDNWA